MKIPNEKVLMLFMGWSFFLVSLLFVALCVFIELPASGVDNAKYATGFLLGTCISTVITYYFGSSRGSEKKSDDISEMIKSPEIRMEELKQKGIADESIQKTVRQENQADCADKGKV